MTETSNFAAPVNAPFDVVIAGGGLVGLALALSLCRGLGPRARIALLARVPTGSVTSANGRAVALSAASVLMLERLGVWERVKPAAQPVSAIDITDSALEAGVRPILLSYDNMLGSGEAASHIVPNGALEAAHTAQVAGCPSIERITGDDVTSFKAGPDMTVITLASGRVLGARLLVAADGARSRLRTMAGIETTGHSYGQTGITVTVRHEVPHGGHAVQHFLPNGPFAILPLPGNRACITWSEEAASAQRLLALNDQAFIEELEARAGGRLGTLTLEGPRQSWPLELALARAMIATRFALVGDAAHSVHPIAGQGLNLGLRDAASLAEVMVDSHRLGLDIGASTTLERYERWRRFDNWKSASSFDALNRLFSTTGTLRRSLREFGLGFVDRIPGLKQRLVSEAAGVTGELPRLLRGEAI